ncbi:MAG TPA: amidohydrolase family protein [Chloroflexota bacterium]|jgi:predicted TIM-barrel fold metal-dependent hydrolase|nr:amidohydrolase family protein [Chloroflexota bacterium]
MRIIDADGHIMEDMPAISKFVPDVWKDRWNYKVDSLFPPLDHLHSQQLTMLPGASGNGKFIRAPEWLEFLTEINIESTVLYPTRGLAHGKMVDYEWSAVATRAYNDWLHDAYLQVDPRFGGMALIPMQEPSAAAEELERAVTELGMRGAMLPSTGLPNHLGAKEYWPVYEVADRLGCALAVHGGAHSGFGMDHFNVYGPVHGLGHPFGQMTGLGAMLFNGIFDHFPNARYAYLEGGVAWFLVCLERFDRSWETHLAHDPRNEHFKLRDGERVSAYMKRQIAEGRLFIGCEGEEPSIAEASRVVGAEPFLFSTDFPHEVTAQMCRHEIEELLENDEMGDEEKGKILAGNAERFYRLAPVGAAA